MNQYVALINPRALRMFAHRSRVAARARYRPRRCRSRQAKTAFRRLVRGADTAKAYFPIPIFSGRFGRMSL